MKYRLVALHSCANWAAFWCVGFMAGCAGSGESPSADVDTTSETSTGIESSSGTSSSGASTTSTAASSHTSGGNTSGGSGSLPTNPSVSMSNSAQDGGTSVHATSTDGDSTTSAPSSTNGETTATDQPSDAGDVETSSASDASDVDASDDLPGDEVVSDALIVAPNGEQGAAGTLDAPTTLESAVGRVQPGGTIYLRAGTYTRDASISLAASGEEGAPIRLFAYPRDDGRPRFDFSAMSEDSGNRGFVLSGDHWHVFGFDTAQAGDNCMFVSGSHNTIEFVTFSECADTGLQLGNGAADNLVLNCDSFYNADSSLENADGFAAKLDVGTGNRFIGCRAWNNLDDGWDGYLRPATDVTTSYENCWAIDNGKLKDGSEGAGDGNGFKTGGSDDKDLRHNANYVGCIAAGNVHDGFDHNSNRGTVSIVNSAAHANGTNINFSSSNIAASLTVTNTVSVGDEGSLEASNTDVTHNSWQDGLEATADDFVSLDTNLLKGARKSDGGLPDVDYMKLVAGSDLRNSGIDVGHPFEGSAPDVGPFESQE